MVSKTCLTGSKRNCLHAAKCLLGKMSIIFILSFFLVIIILIFAFHVFVFVFHPQDLNRNIRGEYPALNCQMKQHINELSHTEENKSLTTILSLYKLVCIPRPEDLDHIHSLLWFFFVLFSNLCLVSISSRIIQLCIHLNTYILYFCCISLKRRKLKRSPL